MGARYKWEVTKTYQTTPGPGIYQPRPQKVGPKTNFGASKSKREDKIFNTVPGPGQYDGIGYYAVAKQKNVGENEKKLKHGLEYS